MQDYTANQHLADIKLLAVDMDLTLLADDKSQPEGMPELISELLAAGVMFCPASGRPTPTLKEMFAAHKADIAFLGDNGANTVYKDQQVYKSIIDSALWHDCLAFAVTQPGCVPVLNGLERGYVLKRDIEWRAGIDLYYTACDFVDDFESIDPELDKFSFLYPAYDAEPAFREIWEPRYQGKFFVTNAGREWIDFMNPGVHKGTGVKALAEFFGLGLGEIACVGDTYNDIPMLKAAGQSFVVANAEEHMHEHADWLIPSNNERGVATLMRAIIAAKRG